MRRRYVTLSAAIGLALTTAACASAPVALTAAEVAPPRPSNNAAAEVSPSPSAPAACPADQVVNLQAVRAQSSAAAGIPQPLIANYGGKWATDDPRNFVAQISGAEAVKANLNLGPDVKPDDRVVVVTEYGDFQPNLIGPPDGTDVTKLPHVNVQISAQDTTAGDPPMYLSLVAACAQS